MRIILAGFGGKSEDFFPQNYVTIFTTLHKKRTLHWGSVAFRSNVECYYLPHQTNS